ncbi:hypothetical protein D3C76_1474270 [compost metagenome]
MVITAFLPSAVSLAAIFCVSTVTVSMLWPFTSLLVTVPADSALPFTSTSNPFAGEVPGPPPVELPELLSSSLAGNAGTTELDSAAILLPMALTARTVKM